MRDAAVERIAERAAADVARAVRDAVPRLVPVDAGSLPQFMRSGYFIAEAVIGGRTHVFFVPRPGAVLSAGQIDIHMRRFSGGDERIPVLATLNMTARMSERLRELGASFVVPGRHLWVDGAVRMMGLRFDRPRGEESHPRPEASIGAYAQAFLLLQILSGDPPPRATMSYARHFGITQTTALNAVDELVCAGFCHRERNGKPQPLEFLLAGRELFLAAMPLLASPVSSVGYLAGSLSEDFCPNSGEWALARRSMLAEPKLPTLAVHRGWPLVSIASRAGMEICNAEDADLRVERWRYPPESLSADGLADPLSLFLIFRDHPDERIALSACDMLEDFWSAAISPTDDLAPAHRNP